jgi:hypothetical protein
MERYPRGTAFHEAGHAVVAYCLGHQVIDIHVSKDDESGHTNTSGPELTRIDRVTFLLAGMATQTIWNVRSKHLAGGRDLTDFLNLAANEGLGNEERDALRQDAYQRANRILHAHKAKVEAIAERLMEHGQMNGSEFLELMRG